MYLYTLVNIVWVFSIEYVACLNLQYVSLNKSLQDGTRLWLQEVTSHYNDRNFCKNFLRFYVLRKSQQLITSNLIQAYANVDKLGMGHKKFSSFHFVQAATRGNKAATTRGCKHFQVLENLQEFYTFSVFGKSQQLIASYSVQGSASVYKLWMGHKKLYFLHFVQATARGNKAATTSVYKSLQ